MRDIDRIRTALAAAQRAHGAVVLATVLGVEGSVYRGAGARMLVLSQGGTIGAVSGGCLEADIVARAPDVLARGIPEVVRYDTRAGDEVVLGLGLGCQGVIDVLLEPLASDHLANAVTFYDELAAHREPVTLLTITQPQGADGPIAMRAVVDADNKLLHGDARLLMHGAGITRERIKPAVDFVICGAGTDAIPLARLAGDLGWNVTVADHRPALLTRERFPGVQALVTTNCVDDDLSLARQVRLDNRTVAIVMAHAAAHDRAYLHSLLREGASYIGVLGPRRRTVELLGSTGDIPGNVYAPVGLDIGAESPEEIALAIVAEIASAITFRSGGSLRNRQTPIHDHSREGALVPERVDARTSP